MPSFKKMKKRVKKKNSGLSSGRGATVTRNSIPLCKILTSDNLHLAEIPDESVDLVVTSPPYFNVMDYHKHIKGDKSERYRVTRTPDFERDYRAFLSDVTARMKSVFRVLKIGGHAALVLGTSIVQEENGRSRHAPFPFDVVSEATTILDFMFQECIVWNKTTAGAKRFGVFIQHPKPGYYYPNLITEYIMILRKPWLENPAGDISFRRDDAEEIEITEVMKKDTANSLWTMAPVPPNVAKKLGHPCPFPPDLVKRIIELYSHRRGVVLDPWCGCGIALQVANDLGRKYIGYDIEEKYCKLARKLVNVKPKYRVQHLVPQYNLIGGESCDS